MSDQQDQQLFQIQNILETLLEATDHFSKSVQQREFPQIVYTFTSITEGDRAVAHSLNELNEYLTDHTDILASILVKINNQLEEYNLSEIPSSLTDSISQEFKHILKKFQEAYDNQT